MTSDDRNDLMPAQEEKLEWVTPKISLMDAEDTEGNKRAQIRPNETRKDQRGPS